MAGAATRPTARSLGRSVVVDVLAVPDRVHGQFIPVEAIDHPVVADPQPATGAVTHLGGILRGRVGNQAEDRAQDGHENVAWLLVQPDQHFAVDLDLHAASPAARSASSTSTSRGSTPSDSNA